MRWPAFATIWLLCMAVCGCGGSSSGGGSGGGGSSGPADLASAPSDLTPRSTAGIACGAVACTISQLCCSSDSGKTGDCAQNGGSCGGVAYHCDGPEDCAPALHECCFQGSSVPGGSISQCQTPGNCAMQPTGQLMCHVDADCGASLKCCPAAAGSPYAFCKSSC